MTLRVSPEDRHLLDLAWTISPKGYVVRYWTEDGVPRHELLHRRVISAPDGALVVLPPVVSRVTIDLIGSFDTVEDAHAAYVAAAQRLHGEFARAG